MADLSVHQSVLLTDLVLCVNRWRIFSPGWYVCILAEVQLTPEEPEVPGLVAMVNCYRLVEPDESGIIYSHALANFWVPLDALRERDWWAVLGCIERGVSRRAD